ncbi:MAG: substrate-binding domain-containing protein [bacterium]|nr:substrate-binding domain-containing protein [bacterium]MDE0353390.1 substrate-binding domain-containing protein [bacterium]
MIGLVTKTDANPFFVTMRDAALRQAEEADVELRAMAGSYDGDWETQVEAIESLVASGAAGILITPSDPAALTDTVRRAREAGVLVIALDTPFDPPDSVDATFATDNFRAGELIGAWARARTDVSVPAVRIVTLDGSEARITLDVMRNQGFLSGFGVDIRDPTTMYDEDDPRIVGRAVTMGTAAGGRAAMEDLIRQDPEVNVVYTVNEPAAAGAFLALKDAGKENDVLIVSIDGSCEGVGRVATGEIDATSMQYPHKMATLGVDAIVEYSKTGRTPENTPGLDFHDTGVTLVTQHPTPGVPSITVEQAQNECWA